MKDFKELIEETSTIANLEELEAAADLFDFGIEKGHYNLRQAKDFNATYWKMKNRILAGMVSAEVKGNALDIMSIVESAPDNLKDNLNNLIGYVNNRLKALRGSLR
jgi:hypothetical protein